MSLEAITELVSKADCALELERKIVGVKFISTAEEFQRAEAQSFDNRMPYCVLVKLASMGHSRKAHLDNFGCLAAARALVWLRHLKNGYQAVSIAIGGCIVIWRSPKRLSIIRPIFR